VIIDIDDYENTFVENNHYDHATTAITTITNLNHQNDDDDDGNKKNESVVVLNRRRRMGELRLNCEDRREILCALMKPIDDATTTTTAAAAAANSLEENQPPSVQSQQQQQQDGSSPHQMTQQQQQAAASAAAITSLSSPTAVPLYTKEELRKAERKLERERRCASGNAARTRRRLKRGFFMPLTPEEEESYNVLNGGGIGSSFSGVVIGNDVERLDYSSSSSSSSSSSGEEDNNTNDDDDGVGSMDISPKKKVVPTNGIQSLECEETMRF